MREGIGEGNSGLGKLLLAYVTSRGSRDDGGGGGRGGMGGRVLSPALVVSHRSTDGLTAHRIIPFSFAWAGQCVATRPSWPRVPREGQGAGTFVTGGAAAVGESEFVDAPPRGQEMMVIIRQIPDIKDNKLPGLCCPAPLRPQLKITPGINSLEESKFIFFQAAETT